MMSTSSIGDHSPGRHRQGDAVLDLDLNRDPPDVHQEQEGPSILSESRRVVQADFDEEAADDDVIECTRSAFDEARNNSRRNRWRTIVDVDLDNASQRTEISPNYRRRDSLNQTVPNLELTLNLEGNNNSERETHIKSPEPPKEPVFNCPICKQPFVEEMSTRCGHIFCKKCIKAALKAKRECPICEEKITSKGLVRVFLPSTGSP
ncbi:E3 ubiquitin-protein ligase BRE1-like [Prosopis cineraria]|uniref:E3 ubiquitin-protein ligase BRE1-like n=1 Tax=Prosopis cineraria TaxID=364024 RepID=UPI00240EA6C5|nr:E3 ubiquitin-protein ligase BRE1-like [Prosopis cineraria]